MGLSIYIKYFAIVNKIYSAEKCKYRGIKN